MFAPNNVEKIMGYRIYINHDCKAIIRQTRCWRPWQVVPFAAAGLVAMIATFAVMPMIAPPPSAHRHDQVPYQPIPGAHLPHLPDGTQPHTAGTIPAADTATDAFPAMEVESTGTRRPSAPAWQTVTVASGDSLSLIFSRLGLNGTTLHKVLASGEQAHGLKRLVPGQQLDFLIVDGILKTLRFDPTPASTLEFTRQDAGYSAAAINHHIDIENRLAEAEISESLFLAGQAEGLSDNMIMELVALFGWDIDFALDVREGDRFKVLYERQFRAGSIVGEGPVLAAEFVNQGKTYRVVRYTGQDGASAYYSEDGTSIRKAFLRTPLNFTRISSNFSLGRKHPILNTIRAHRGVDYAAPSGTPVRASGDGTVVFIGNKGGYGHTIVLNHGNNYSTLYAHMSKFAFGIRRGTRVDQGRVIGYVGMTGLATGPHLHYEFQIGGIHRNPLTVELPKAPPIAATQRQRFLQQTAPLLAELEDSPSADTSVIALNNFQDGTTSVH